MDLWTTLIALGITIIAGFFLGFFYRKYIIDMRAGSVSEKASTLIGNAKKEAGTIKKEAGTIKKEAILEGKEEIQHLRAAAEDEIKKYKSELKRIEGRLQGKEDSLDRKAGYLDKKEQSVSHKVNDLEAKNKKLDDALQKETLKLEAIAELTKEEARAILTNKIEDEAKYEAAKKIREIEGKLKEDSDKMAKKIISQAIQRCAMDHVSETTVSVVNLPNDEMKGRIIGREGRNIRIFENLTGINIIVDDTPEAVILSSFDPVRREIARVTLENLIMDGRIHPTRIEEMYEKASKVVNNEIKLEGEQAVFDTGISGLNQGIIKVLGRLKYRTSYGQNVLIHSKEVSYVAGIIAAELGLNIKQAKRAGLLHDIGKALTHDIDGSHAVIGAELARRLHEDEEICHSIEAHHNEVEVKSILDVIIQAADQISGGRPGARRETLENYVKRLETLEKIATEFKGIEKAFAIQAGREIRVIVRPEDVDENTAMVLARDIANKIESEMEYPGQIRVTVIRESRAVEYAK
ncbi:MAG: ribonuclease Y [Actinomycetia bacterium]|nr:ribonuclease Y [Actinomycetes bacterium]